ncbi:hypothetical protein KIW84_031393 [Lathyrus oleraceus]|uniref:Uncharacterized protein n=1 Tax=Pisum sativum TaxID=3888 RepID=A0A9D4XSA3_PEA|nr:hypothetical protein KIW84_031393 [Pisum sativum]
MLKTVKILVFLIFHQPVRKGTNGGVTKAGLLAAAAGGSVIGLSYVLLEFSTIKCGSDRVLKQLLVIPIATTAGLGGSIIDSLLGATLQFSGFCSIRQKLVCAYSSFVTSSSSMEDSWADSSGLMIVYFPISLQPLNVVMGGRDSSFVGIPSPAGSRFWKIQFGASQWVVSTLEACSPPFSPPTISESGSSIDFFSSSANQLSKLRR